MMSKNLESTTKLTEFAPLSPEERRTGVGLIFSRFFKRGGSREPSPVTVADNTSGQVTPTRDQELEQVVSAGTDDWSNRDDISDHSSARESTASLHPSTLPFPIYADVGDGRSLPNVLKRISNLLAMKSSGLQAYKDTDFKQYWMPDSVSKECYDCCDKFTTFRRRHHCRVCGQIFCSRCCNQEIPGKIMGCTGDLRVCTYCCKVVLSYLQSPDIGADLSADLRALQEDLQSKFGEIQASVTSPHGNANLNAPTVNIMQSPIELGRDRTVGNSRTSGRRKHSYQEDRFALGRGSNLASPSSYLASEELQLSAEERWQALQNSSSLRALWEEIRQPIIGIPLQTHRYRLRSFPACFVGTELVDLLLANNRAATMVQAVALGQALIDGGYMECISHVEPIFQDGYALYRLRHQPTTTREFSSPPSSPPPNHIETENLWTKQLDQIDSVNNTDSESEGIPNVPSSNDQDNQSIPSTNSAYYLDLDVQENRVQLRRPKQKNDNAEEQSEADDVQQVPNNSSPLSDNRREHRSKNKSQDLSSTGISREFLTDTLLVEGSQNRELVPTMGWHQVQHLRTDNGEREAYTRLGETFEQHEKQLLQQLLSSEGLPQSWGETVIPLVHQVVDLVRPDVRNDSDDMDIRQYVQFKKVSGGSRGECSVISGVVCTKNVAHRLMPTRLTNPRILLLGCSIIYERVEGRLIALEPLIMQEQDYLKNVVARIVSLQPDIVVVQRTVSRLAQDLLLEQGITLVLNVKLSVLDRLARSTLSDIINCIDAHVGKPRIGMCHNFYLKTFELDVSSKTKTLMFFDGCATHLGCTAILRGGNSDELRRLKRVISHLILVNYSWRHEKSFLMDEFAMPPSAPVDSFFADEDFSSNVKHDNSEVADGALKDNNGLKSKTNKCKETCDKELTKDKVPVDKVKIRSRAPSREKGSCSGEDKKIEAVVDQSDPLHQYLASNANCQSTGEDTDVFSSTSNSQLSVATLPLTNRFRKALDDTVLSSSPYLQFTVPFLETETGRQCALRKFFPDQVFWSPQLSATSDSQPEGSTLSTIKNEELQENSTDDIFVRPYHPFVQARLTKSVESWEVQALLASFRAIGGRLKHPEEREELEETLTYRDSKSDNKNGPLSDLHPQWPQPSFVDALNPINHQRLAVLFCSFSQESQNAPAFCVNPWVVHMELYGRNDIPLGQFLDQYCFRKSYACPSPTCTTPMLQHIRRFVHDAGCVQVTLKELDCQIPVQGNAILMWSWCHICKTVTPVVPMSVDTWSLSFAKYLELRCHGNMYTRRGKENTCYHSLHHDHYQYFGYKDVVASFKYTSIKLWEISLPPPMIINHCGNSASTQSEIQKAAIEEVKQLAWKGYEVFSIVLEKLCLLTSETETSKLEGISHLKNQLKREHANFKSKIEEVQLRLTSPTLEARRIAGEAVQATSDSSVGADKEISERLWEIEDCLVQLKRMIAEAVAVWNSRLGELTKKKDEKSKKSGDSSKLLPSSAVVDSHCEDPGSDLVQHSSLGSPLTCSSDHEAVECNENISNVLAEQGADGNINPSLTSSSETSHAEFWYSSSDKKNSSSLDEELAECSHQRIPQKCSSFSSPTVEGLEAGLGVHQAWAEYNQYVLVHNNEVPEETNIEVVKGHERSHSEGDSRSTSVAVEDIADAGSRTERRSVPQVPPAATATVKQIISQLLPSNASATHIVSPLEQQEHHLLPSTNGPLIVVYESEPSSIIAYALSSADYHNKLYENRQTTCNDGPPPSPIELKRKSQQDVVSNDLLNSVESTSSTRRTVLSFLRGGSPNMSANRATSTPRNVVGEYDGVQYTASTTGSVDEEQPIENIISNSEQARPKTGLKSATSTCNAGCSEANLDIHFSDSTTAFHCRIYLAEQFVALRALVCPEGEESYTRSLTRCVHWAARGGKSGSAFCKTKDDRFVLKEMTQHEVQLFLEIAPNYLGYMRRAIEGGQPTLLGKIVGVYRVGFRSTAGGTSTGTTAMKTNFLVMENLFYGRNITQRFDLKGSVRNRLVEPTLPSQGGEIVLLDENLLKMTCDAPLYIQPHSKLVLTLAIEKDTQFLSSQAVMDYSLLVGLDEDRKELVIGIIDYIRTFTWDKRLETMVKSSGILGGQGKLPTVVSPELYQSRFMAAMHRYFLPVPDRWTGLGRGVDC